MLTRCPDIRDVLDAETTLDLPDPRRFVVFGNDTLAYRLCEELANRHRGHVTAIVPSLRAGYGPRIARLSGVEIIDADTVDGDVLAEADVATAEALALVVRDDVANIDAALRAHEMNPRLRIVVRMFNTSLGDGLAELPYCVVLSDAAMAAPAFVTAAAGEKRGSVHLHDDTLEVVARTDARADEIVCGLAVVAGGDDPELLPADQAAADLVLIRSRRRPTAKIVRGPRLTHHYPVRAVLARVWRRLRLILSIFAAVLIAAAIVLAWIRPDLSGWEAAYLAMIKAFGGASADLGATTVEQIVDTTLSFASIALIPVLTATAVDAVIKSRLELQDGTLVRRASGHVVVVGLGGVGSHVLRLLYDRGLDVVGIDASPAAPGVQVARDLRIPVIIGDASRRDTLLAASVSTCRTLVPITSDDAINLQTALVGRAIRRDVPVILRLFDGEFADRIQRAFNLTVSRSVSYLAAPAFAAQMLGQVLDTIPVGRHVLLVAHLTVGAYAPLEGDPVGDLRRPGEAWIVELTNPAGQRLAGSAAAGRRLQRGDRLLVVATRRGLARLIAETRPAPESAPRKPIVIHDSLPFDPTTLAQRRREPPGGN